MGASQFPDNLGLIGVGDGKVVLPSPTITAGWNLIVRDYEDRSFRWMGVAGLIQDPTQGYIFQKADSYRLEITPDLGFPDIDEMFTAYNPATGFGNGRLRIFPDLTIGVELTDNGDETVTYQVPIEEMYRVLAPGFDRYLWRIRAVSESDLEGHPSIVQSFKGRVVVPDVSWTLEDVTKAPTGLTYTLHGTRTATVTQGTVNDSDSWTTYPSPSTWEAEVPLDARPQH